MSVAPLNKRYDVVVLDERIAENRLEMIQIVSVLG